MALARKQKPRQQQSSLKHCENSIGLHFQSLFEAQRSWKSGSNCMWWTHRLKTCQCVQLGTKPCTGSSLDMLFFILLKLRGLLFYLDHESMGSHSVWLLLLGFSNKGQGTPPYEMILETGFHRMERQAGMGALQECLPFLLSSFMPLSFSLVLLWKERCFRALFTGPDYLVLPLSGHAHSTHYSPWSAELLESCPQLLQEFFFFNI